MAVEDGADVGDGLGLVVPFAPVPEALETGPEFGEQLGVVVPSLSRTAAGFSAGKPG